MKRPRIFFSNRQGNLNRKNAFESRNAPIATTENSSAYRECNYIRRTVPFPLVYFYDMFIVEFTPLFRTIYKSISSGTAAAPTDTIPQKTQVFLHKLFPKKKLPQSCRTTSYFELFPPIMFPPRTRRRPRSPVFSTARTYEV